MTRLYHGPGTWVRAWVNDLPMYDDSSMTMRAVDFPATPWFVPGENEVVLELEPTPMPQGLSAAPAFDLTFFGEGPKEAPSARPHFVTLLETKFPQVLEELPPEERKLPVRWSKRFTPEGHIPSPIWADNPKENIPEKGTPELLAALFAVQQAFINKDVDALMAATELKLEDQLRYHPGSARLVPADIKKEHAEMLAEGQWDVKAFDPDRIRFRSCAGGRVAYARRDDGGPALEARNGPHAWRARPLLVRQGADWRIFR